MFFRQIVDEKLSQYAYLIGCQQTREAIIIDPQRDVERYVAQASGAGLKIVAAAETHLHADFISGLRQFATQFGVKVFVSDEGGNDWRYEWLPGSNHDFQLLRDGDKFDIGSIGFEVRHTPGHSPEHISFAVTDFAEGAQLPLGVLTGDFVFVGDVGRPDLLESAAGQSGTMVAAAHQLYESIQKFKRWPVHAQLWPGHGAGSVCGRSLGAMPTSTIGHELTYNRSVVSASHANSFVESILEFQPEPPHYFSRMKRDNRRGPSVLHHAVSPTFVPADELASVLQEPDTVLLDTRSWSEYLEGHIPGSLFTPLNRAFPTIVGSYVEEKSSIVLLVEKSRLREAMTDLIRIGLDNIVGYTTPEQASIFRQNGGNFLTMPEIDVASLATRLDDKNACILDVRSAMELREVGRIPGAVNVAHTRLLPDGQDIPRDRELLVYCRSGNRSTYASAFLERTGHRVVHVSGGIEAWLAMGFEVS